MSQRLRHMLTATLTACSVAAGVAFATPAGLAIPAAQAAEIQPVLSAPVPASADPLGSSPIDSLGRPAPFVLDGLENLANQPFVAPDARNTILAAVSFFRGGGEGGVPLPEGAPTFAQFWWPTVSSRCIGGALDATGTAIAVPGPATLPLPGVNDGQTAFVFTALGTGPVDSTQHTSMQVQWVNLNTLKFGSTPLSYNGMNPEGPATISGVADTGKGTVLAYLTGGVSIAGTADVPASTCNFAPTAAQFDVR